MQLLVRAFPVLPGKERDMHALAKTLQTSRSGEIAEFYQRHGVSRESWHLQETPNGAWVVAVSQFPEKSVDEAGQEYAASQKPFDRWFKDQVILITGIDPDTTPLGPPTECIFDSAAIKG